MPLIKESEKIKGLKSELGTYAVIVPGARWETKRWPYENFGRLASKLRTKSVIVGSASDAAIARDIVSISNGKAVSMAGQTDIRELISIIRGADFVISNDSGPMHIAAAFGIPVVALFGPTNPVRTGPYGEKHVVLNAGLKCAPCYKKRCATIKCLKDISVDKAYDAVKAVIKEEG
jgi:lipopolysaccharide heptosyltransferase II